MPVSLERSDAPLNYALRSGPQHFDYKTADPYIRSGFVAVWPDEHRAEVKAVSNPSGTFSGLRLGPEIRSALRELGVKHVKFERAEPGGTLREVYVEI